MKDVIIKPDAPNTLLLDRHADYIAAYGSKKDDYVSKGSLRGFPDVFFPPWTRLSTYSVCSVFTVWARGESLMLQHEIIKKQQQKCASIFSFGEVCFLFRHNSAPLLKASSIKKWFYQFGAEELGALISTTSDTSVMSWNNKT